MDVLNEVLITPFLSNFGIFPNDPTFGRYLLDTSEIEIAFEAQSHLTTRRRRVFFKTDNLPSTKVKGYAKSHIEAPAVGDAAQEEYVEVEEGEDVDLTKGELASGQGRRWVFYKIWESSSAAALNGKGRGCDIVFCHGKCCALTLPGGIIRTSRIPLQGWVTTVVCQLPRSIPSVIIIAATGKYAHHVDGVLEMGFRVIIPDLPSVCDAPN